SGSARRSAGLCTRSSKGVESLLLNTHLGRYKARKRALYPSTDSTPHGMGAPRNRRWLSVVPRYNETRRLTQKVGSFIKQIKVLNCLIGQHSSLIARAVYAQNGNKGRLADRRILADRLAHHYRITLGIKQIIRDLVGKT